MSIYFSSSIEFAFKTVIGVADDSILQHVHNYCGVVMGDIVVFEFDLIINIFGVCIVILISIKNTFWFVLFFLINK